MPARPLLYCDTNVGSEGAQLEQLWGQVAQLLQKGENPTVLDARGKPPYSVAAEKEVRDAFRRYMAREDALQWDWTAAGVPSALTPEMEAQQAARQACMRFSKGLPACSVAQQQDMCTVVGDHARGRPTPTFYCLELQYCPALL